MHFLKKKVIYTCLCGKFTEMKKCEGFEIAYMVNGNPTGICTFYDGCVCYNDELIEKYKENEDV